MVLFCIHIYKTDKVNRTCEIFFLNSAHGTNLRVYKLFILNLLSLLLPRAAQCWWTGRGDVYTLVVLDQYTGTTIFFINKRVVHDNIKTLFHIKKTFYVKVHWWNIYSIFRYVPEETLSYWSWLDFFLVDFVCIYISRLGPSLSLLVPLSSSTFVYSSFIPF